MLLFAGRICGPVKKQSCVSCIFEGFCRPQSIGMLPTLVPNM